MFSSGLGRLRLLCGHSHPDLQHPAVVHTGDGDVQALRLEPVPGLGQAAVTAGLGSDMPLLLGITVLTAAIVFGGSLAADLLYDRISIFLCM